MEQIISFTKPSEDTKSAVVFRKKKRSCHDPSPEDVPGDTQVHTFSFHGEIKDKHDDSKKDKKKKKRSSNLKQEEDSGKDNVDSSTLQGEGQDMRPDFLPKGSDANYPKSKKKRKEKTDEVDEGRTKKDRKKKRTSLVTNDDSEMISESIEKDSDIIENEKVSKKKKKNSKCARPTVAMENSQEADETEEKRVKSRSDLLTEETDTDSLPPAVQYLRTWRKDRANWKFQKCRQTWLLKHMFDPTKLGDKDFKTMLKYVKGLQGKAAENTEEKAKMVLDNTVDEIILNRAKSTLQML